MSNTERAGAAYEAVLVDKVTGRIDRIIASLDQLKVAFNQVAPAANKVGTSMQQISGAFTQIERTTRRTAGTFRSALTSMQAQVVNSTVAIGQSLMGIGAQIRNLGFLLTGAGAGISAFLVGSIQEMSTAGEVKSAFDAIFRETADSVDQWAKEFSTRIGRSLTDTRRGLTRFRAAFAGLDFPDEKINEMSQTMQRLSVDFASWLEMADDEAMQRFIGGLAGEAENLSRFGIHLKAAELEQSRFTKALGRSFTKLSEQEKIWVRYNEIIRQMAEGIEATGDAFRTRESLPNQLKALSAAFRGLRTSIGKVFEESAKNVVTILRSMVDVLRKLDVEKVKRLAVIAGGLLVLGTSLTAIGVALQTLGPLIIAAGAAFAGLIGLVVTGLPGLVVGILGLAAAGATLATGFLFFREFPFRQAIERTSEALGRLVDDSENAIRAIKNAVQAEDWEAVWSVVKIAGELTFRDLGETIAIVIAEAITRGVQAGFELIKLPPKALANLPDTISALTARAFDPDSLLDLLRDFGAGGPFNQFFLENEKRMEELRRQLKELGGEPLPGPGAGEGAAARSRLQEQFANLGEGRSIGGFGGAFANAVARLGPQTNKVTTNQEKQIRQGAKQNDLLGDMVEGIEDVADAIERQEVLRFV